MQCTCGGNVSSSDHKVKTEKSANKWAKNFYIPENDLPLNVENFRCDGCTRTGFKVFNKNKEILRRVNI